MPGALTKSFVTNAGKRPGGIADLGIEYGAHGTGQPDARSARIAGRLALRSWG